MENLIPVAVGEEFINVEIISKGTKKDDSEGDGVAKIGGFVIFVPGADVGEVVSFRIVKVFSKFAIAELL